MGTGNEPQKNPGSQHAQPQSGQKSGKGSGRYDEDQGRKAQLGKGGPPPSHPCPDPQRFSDKLNDAGQPDSENKTQASAGK